MLLYKWIWIRCWYDLAICLSKILMCVNWLDVRKLFKFLCLTVLSAKLCCTPILHYLNYMHLKVGLIDGSWYFIKDSYVESFISVFIESYFCNFSSLRYFSMNLDERWLSWWSSNHSCRVDDFARAERSRNPSAWFYPSAEEVADIIFYSLCWIPIMFSWLKCIWNKFSYQLSTWKPSV